MSKYEQELRKSNLDANFYYKVLNILKQEKMKNLITKISCISFILLFAISISAQDYKIKMTSGGKVIVDQVDEITIEGYNGTEVIIQGKRSNDEDEDDRAKGLRVISGSGSVDNTGLGLSAVKEGNDLTIEQVSKNSKGRYTIKIPQGIGILYEHNDHSGEELIVRNFSSEIEVSAHYNDVKLFDITGPMSVNTTHGDVEATFKKVSQNNPITIRSSHGWIDVTMPNDTKANLKLKSSHGDMFTDFNIDKSIKGVNVKNPKKNNCGSCDDNKMLGGINGGGVLVDLYSSHDNIYLRKKN